MVAEQRQIADDTQYPLSEQLQMGQFIDVELQNVTRDRFKTRIVGGKDKQYLVLEQPDIRKYGLLKDRMEELDLLVLRTIFERTSGDCIAFNSYVICKVSHPDKLLFVSYPEQVFHKCLRSEEREQVKFEASIYVDKDLPDAETIHGLIVNISSGGCCFECEVSETTRGLRPTQLLIEMRRPGSDEVHLCRAELRSQRKQKNKLSIGFSFLEGEGFSK